MTEFSQFTYNSAPVARQYAARLGNVINVVPAMKSITDSDPSTAKNTYDQIDGAGFPDPTLSGNVAATGAAGALTGTYAYYITFYDSVRDSEGNPSVQTNSVTPSSEDVDLDLSGSQITNKSANARVDKMRIYRNENGGSVYFLVATLDISDTTYTDDNTDATISANDTLQLDNNPPAANTYGLVGVLNGFMFMAGSYSPEVSTAYDDDFTWSKVSNADQWPTVNRTKIEPGAYGRIRAMHPIGDRMVFYKDRAIFTLDFTENPSGITGDGFGKTVNTIRGAVNQRAVVNVQGTHYVLDERGIYAFTGATQVVDLHYPLMRYWNRVNWDQKLKFSGVWTDDRVYFFVALDDDTECKYAFVLDLVSQRSGRGSRWYIEKYDFGIRDADRVYLGTTSSAEMYEMERRTKPIVMTEYGYPMMLGTGYRDGCDPNLTATATVTGGTSTTIEATAATFTRSNEAGDTSDVRGAYVRFLDWRNIDADGDWSGAYRVTGVSGTTLTVSPAMPSAPPTGAIATIGALPDSKVATGWLDFGDVRSKKMVDRLAIESEPRGVKHTFGVSARRDNQAEFERIVAKDETGYETTIGAAEAQFDQGGNYDDDGRQGVRPVPIGGETFNRLQVEFDATGVDKPTVVDAFHFERDQK